MSDKKRKLSELRDQAGEIDRELLKQLENRAHISREIHRLQEGDGATIDTGEREWLEALESEVSKEVPVDGVRAVFRQVRAMARSIEQPAKVAYMGPEGSFCHQVATEYFGTATSFVESPNAASTLDEVARERAAYAVFPFESSVDGLVQPSITALAQTELRLVAERVAPATYSLMCRTGNLKDIDKVYATPTAHAACELYLGRALPRATVLDVRSPIVAAQLAYEDHGGAAVTPELAGRAADLQVVEANVGDEPDLQFRYGIASARPASRSGKDTTCLLFSVADQPGSLFEVLKHFAERGINLKKLQSRPARGEGWDYVFYVEVSGHVTDRPVVTALEAIKRSTKYLKVLGSFPASA